MLRLVDRVKRTQVLWRAGDAQAEVANQTLADHFAAIGGIPLSLMSTEVDDDRSLGTPT
jgi:hypothetical protein